MVIHHYSIQYDEGSQELVQENDAICCAPEKEHLITHFLRSTMPKKNFN